MTRLLETLVRPAAQVSERQLAVLDGIARRNTIKVIAGELAISESAVNQHIRTLKERFSANSLAELALLYAEISSGRAATNCRKTASRKNRLPVELETVKEGGEDDVAPTQTFHDAMTYHQRAPWDEVAPMRLVPEVLNGADGRWMRAAAIVTITIGLFAAAIVGLGAVQGVSAVIADRQSASNSVH